MAIRELFSVIQSNVDIAASTELHAGQPVMKDSNGLAVLASRGTYATTNSVKMHFAGLAADDTARTGNTMIEIDPVGATKLDAAGNFIASNNGFFSCTKRALADYQDETVTNVSDLVSGSTGWQGPRRGLGVYTSPSAQFIVDRYAVATSDYAVYVTAGAGDDNVDAIANWTVGSLLTIGSAASTPVTTGILVRLADTAHGEPVARIDKVEGSGANVLVYITLL